MNTAGLPGSLQPSKLISMQNEFHPCNDPSCERQILLQANPSQFKSKRIFGKHPPDQPISKNLSTKKTS